MSPEQNSPTFAQTSLASGKSQIEVKKANRSINTRKDSFLMKPHFLPENYITK